MSTYTDFMDLIRAWAARPDYSDLLVDGFMRSAESNLNRLMRVKEMMVMADALILETKTALPTGWRELDYVRINNGRPLTFLNREDFFKGEQSLLGKYTITGNVIQFGFPRDEIEGKPVEVSYYKSVPHLSEAEPNNWLHDYYHDIYLQACLVLAYAYGTEMERSAATSSLVSEMVASANEEHQRSRTSGSTMRLSRNRGVIG